MMEDAQDEVWWPPWAKHLLSEAGNVHSHLGQSSLEDPVLEASWVKWFSSAPRLWEMPVISHKDVAKRQTDGSCLPPLWGY